MNGITRRASVLLITAGTALIACAGVAHATPAVDGSHQVWVCKYVGQPGDFETLKDGKNPIIVDVAAADAYVGADFADGQTHSKVIDIATEANTGQGETYTGEATCPTSEVTTTSTTSTSSPSTTSSVPSTPRSSVPSKTSLTPPSSPGTQTPRRGTTVLTPSSPSSSPGSPTLPFTGTSTLPLLVTGLGLLAGGVALVLRGKAVRG